MTIGRTRAIVEAAERLEQHLHDVAESRTVGRNASLADVVYAVEHGGALDGALARENVRQLLLAIALPASPPVPEAKLRAVYDAAERLVARNAEGGSLVEAWEAIEAAIALPAKPAPAWTRTPPSEPGLYFLRVPDPRGKHRIKIGAFNPQQGHGEVSFIGGDLGVPLAELNEHEFWPVSLQEPPV